MEEKRAVITGMGVVAPNGIGINPFWDSVIHGRSGVRKITHFDVTTYPSHIAGVVSDFEPLDYLDPKTAKRLSRFAQFAFASAKMAVEDSRINFAAENPLRAGVFTGTAIGGGDVIEIQHTVFMEKGLKRLSPYAVVAISTASASGAIGCEFNLKGPNTTISSGCNTGLDACYLAYNAIRLGDADIMLVGAGESPVTPYIHGLFCASGFLSRENENPPGALKPCDIHADGMVMGEGGACIVIEELQHALKRDATIYGEIAGYSALNEAFDLFGVDTDHRVMAQNFRQTLRNARMDVREIDYINAHGNGILSYDVSETEAIKEVFGEHAYAIPVSFLKPITGHSLSVTAVFQIISSLLTFRNRIVPPTVNLKNPDPKCDLNYVTNGLLEKDIGSVLINAHGFGGRLTALILKKLLIHPYMS